MNKEFSRKGITKQEFLAIDKARGEVRVGQAREYNGPGFLTGKSEFAIVTKVSDLGKVKQITFDVVTDKGIIRNKQLRLLTFFGAYPDVYIEDVRKADSAFKSAYKHLNKGKL